MATFTVLQATQDMLRIEVDTDGEGSPSAQLTQADLVSHCVAGPLKSLLAAPLFQAPASTPGEGIAGQPGVAAWSDLAKDGRLSVYATGNGPDAVWGSYNFLFTNPNNMFYMVVGGGAGTVIFELNFRHSINR